MSVASRPSTLASELPVSRFVFVARGVSPRSTPCACAFRGVIPARVFPDMITRRHGLTRLPPNWVGWAERVVTSCLLQKQVMSGCVRVSIHASVQRHMCISGRQARAAKVLASTFKLHSITRASGANVK